MVLASKTRCFPHSLSHSLFSSQSMAGLHVSFLSFQWSGLIKQKLSWWPRWMTRLRLSQNVRSAGQKLPRIPRSFLEVPWSPLSTVGNILLVYQTEKWNWNKWQMMSGMLKEMTDYRVRDGQPVRNLRERWKMRRCGRANGALTDEVL